MVAPPGLCYGRLDLEARAILPEERRVILAALQPLRSPRWYCSPAERCRALAAALEAPPACLDPALLEFDFGDWEGRSWDSIPRDALDRWAADPAGFTASGGESTTAFTVRLRGVANHLLQQEGDAVVVAHGGPLRLLPAMLRGENPDLLAATPSCGSVTLVTLPTDAGPRRSA
ncbi:histidine phosphatase family protein [Roseomonas elaeocarpi]|uniref:Histidine phosphatase family protein n=1 Tax=Roseomonas elaeocarpi TaxID=907779 RepID=A0ABV6JVH9_9PROT